MQQTARTGSTAKLFALALTATLAAGAVLAQTMTPPAGGHAGHLYAMTNAAGGNAVVHYGRGADGKLTRLETVSTGGNGTGGFFVPDMKKESVDPLFANDALLLTKDHRFLLGVNAVSGTVSSFKVSGDGSLKLVGAYRTGGDLPTNLAVSGSLVYVGHAKANAAGVQITGLRLSNDGSLAPIEGAAYPTSGKTLITQVLFSPDGKLLEVSELMTGHVDLFPVSTEGTLGKPVYNASAASGPFGAFWVGNTRLLVSEVHPMVKNAGSVSSYAVSASGVITPLSPAVKNGQNATCWLTLTPDGQYLYASNTSSGSVSLYRFDPSGALTLLKASAARREPGGATDFLGNPSSGPVDSVVSADGRFFYQQFSGLGVISAYAVGADGGLTPVAGGDGTGLPKLGSDGLAGY